MRSIGSALLALMILSGAGFAQTIELGQTFFLNREGGIIVAIDTSVAVRKINSPYIMFMAFFVAGGNDNRSIHRDDVTMIYKGQEYKMPSYKEWLKEYNAATSDWKLYNTLGKENLSNYSELRLYSFPSDTDYFPLRDLRTDEGSLTKTTGFRTNLYFKNPGFKNGDELVIMVKDRKNPEIKGTCGVILK
jgi:hypothetical protein